MCSLGSSRRYAKGVTLIELMVTVSIVALLVSLAMPSFGRVIASNRIASGVNDFIAAVGLARMEALRRNTRAGVCAADSGGTACGTDWNNGYLVFYETGSSPATKEIVRTGSFSEKDTVSGAGNDILFDRRGQGIQAVALDYKPQNSAYASLQRCMRLTLAGAVTVVEGACQ